MPPSMHDWPRPQRRMCPVAEPTKLLSAEEFRKGFIQMNPVAVHDLCYAALARVAELEAERDAWGSARLPAIERERDALAAEVAELRAALEQVRAWDSAPYRLRAIAIAALAAQPQGERGAQP